MAVVLVFQQKLNPFVKSKNRKEFIETISLLEKVVSDVSCCDSWVRSWWLYGRPLTNFNRYCISPYRLQVARSYISAHKNVETKINDFKELDFTDSY